jgi:hypothetical protein
MKKGCLDTSPSVAIAPKVRASIRMPGHDWWDVRSSISLLAAEPLPP